MRRGLIIVFLSIAILGTLLAAVFCVGSVNFVKDNLIGEPAGEGPKAETGYKACAPFIAALESYKADHDSYPQTLDELVPDYLPDLSVDPEDFLFSYRIKDASYQLRFSYSGPGNNICTYTPEEGWYCYGYW